MPSVLMYRWKMPTLSIGIHDQKQNLKLDKIDTKIAQKFDFLLEEEVVTVRYGYLPEDSSLAIITTLSEA